MTTTQTPISTLTAEFLTRILPADVLAVDGIVWLGPEAPRPFRHYIVPGGVVESGKVIAAAWGCAIWGATGDPRACSVFGPFRHEDTVRAVRAVLKQVTAEVARIVKRGSEAIETIGGHDAIALGFDVEAVAHEAVDTYEPAWYAALAAARVLLLRGMQGTPEAVTLRGAAVDAPDAPPAPRHTDPQRAAAIDVALRLFNPKTTH